MSAFHEKLLKGKAVAIACPKLDDTGPYVEKLTAIFSSNSIRSITVAIMEVPCCMGLAMVVKEALKLSKQDLPLSIQVISIQGDLKSNESLSPVIRALV